MRTLLTALAVSTLIAGPVAAAPGNGKAYGHEAKVCLLTFSSAATFGSDASVTKAQYVPLSIAEKLTTDTTTQGIAYYGFGDLSATDQARIDFYYPDGSTAFDITQLSDTETLCGAFQDYAASQDADDDDDMDTDD